VANLTLRALGLAPGWEISAGAYNVFGARYADPVPLDYRQDTIPQDGPTFRLKVMRRF
jgi:outer membrane receptor protein involved in Fe transport